MLSEPNSFAANPNSARITQPEVLVLGTRDLVPVAGRGEIVLDALEAHEGIVETTVPGQRFRRRLVRRQLEFPFLVAQADQGAACSAVFETA